MLKLIKRAAGYGELSTEEFADAFEHEMSVIQIAPPAELKDKAAEASQLIVDAADADEQFCDAEIERHTQAIAALTEKRRMARHVKAIYQPTITALVEAHHQVDYDAAEDSRKSYDAAVEAKRKRGDKHWPKRASQQAAPAQAAE